MFHFLQKEPCTIRFLCRPEDSEVIAPPVPAKAVLPDWFRKLPAVDPQHLSTTNNGLTVKRSMPFLDAMTAGWILPLAATVRLDIKGGGRAVDAGWEFDRTMVSNHGAHQVTGNPKEPVRRASSTITGRSARRRVGAACSCRRSTGQHTHSNAWQALSTPTPTPPTFIFRSLRRSGQAPDPSRLTVEAAREQVGALAPQAVLDFNHYFRPEQHAGEPCVTTDCLARALIGWPAAGDWPGLCTGGVRIGLVDTAINPDHSAFEGGSIEIIRLVDEKLPESGKQHGTAVAALLVGSATSRTPGLVPGGMLIAVDAFYRARRQDDRSDAYNLVRALDLLAGRELEVINLSLTGPANLLLEQAVKKVGERGIVMVAAAGNDGPQSEPVYPAAYEEVLAVTAIDRRKRPYRRAGRGEHIDFAAPGVAVWTAASISGARPKTGTSFAAPFVTAAAALMKAAKPGLTPGQIRDLLTGNAEDLGEPGKDPVFGWGLLNARAICAAAP